MSKPNYRLANGIPVFSLSPTDTDLVYHEIFVEDVYRQHSNVLMLYAIRQVGCA